ncbi:MAG TPA: AI-2E family transporter [Spirillospora sp.]|nr:AI-2E family transporter [Spirillospora sp.]
MDAPPEEIKTPEPEYGAEWSRWARRVAGIILLIAGVFAATLLGSVLSNVVMAFILAFALFFPVRALTRWLRLSYDLAVLLVFIAYLIGMALVVGNLITSVLPFVSNLVSEGRRNLTIFLEFLQGYEPGDATILGAQGEAARILDTIYGPLSEFVKTFNLGSVGDALPTLVDTAGSAAGTIGGVIGSMFLVHLLAVLFLLEIPGLLRWGQEIIQPQYRREIAIVLNRIGQVWVAYFRGQILIALLIGALTTVQLLILGIPGALVVGIFTAFISLIPLLGGFIALLALLLVALVRGSTTLEVEMVTLVLLTVVPNLIAQQVIWNLVAPRILGDAVALPVPIIILGLIIGTQVGGLLGALLAAPVMGILRVIVEYILKKIQGGDPYPDEPEPPWITTGLFEG